eukprot:gene38781-50969_t
MEFATYLRGFGVFPSHYYWNESEVPSEKHDAWFVYMYSNMTVDERRASSDAASRKVKDVESVISNYWQLVEREKVDDFIARDKV